MAAPDPRDFDEFGEFVTADLVFRISTEEEDICPKCEDVVTPCEMCIHRHATEILHSWEHEGV